MPRKRDNDAERRERATQIVERLKRRQGRVPLSARIRTKKAPKKR